MAVYGVPQQPGAPGPGTHSIIYAPLTTTVTYNSGPNYGSSQATSGGQGTWVSPGNADGAPDSSFATWAVP